MHEENVSQQRGNGRTGSDLLDSPLGDKGVCSAWKFLGDWDELGDWDDDCTLVMMLSWGCRGGLMASAGTGVLEELEIAAAWLAA